MNKKIKIQSCSVIALYILLLFTHNMFPYFGLRFESTQTMFSNLQLDNLRRENNHLIMPQIPLSDSGDYFEDIELKLTPSEQTDLEVNKMITTFRKHPTLSLELIRSVFHRVCIRGFTIEAKMENSLGEIVHLNNACAVQKYSANHWWIPNRLFPVQDEFHATLQWGKDDL